MLSAGTPPDKIRYKGRNLLYLLAAICLPAGLLYLRLVLGLAASDNRLGPEQSQWLARSSSVFLVAFFLVQLICVHYIQGLLTPRPSKAGKTAQYAAVLVTCISLSLTGAIVLEAIGLNMFLRARFR